MKVRKATKDDSRPVWLIRNHPTLRSLFFNTSVIDFKDHDKWFQNTYFKDKKDNHCFILEQDRSVIGYCRLDYDKEAGYYIISIAIAPGNQGRGLGQFLFSKVLLDFRTGADIRAEMKKNNRPSINLFERNGFKIINENENNYYLKYYAKK